MCDACQTTLTGSKVFLPNTRTAFINYLMKFYEINGKVALVDLVTSQFCIAAQYTEAQLMSVDAIDIAYHTACHAYDLGQSEPLVEWEGRKLMLSTPLAAATAFDLLDDILKTNEVSQAGMESWFWDEGKTPYENRVSYLSWLHEADKMLVTSKAEASNSSGLAAPSERGH